MTQFYKVWLDTKGKYLHLKCIDGGASIMRLFPDAIEVTLTEFNIGMASAPEFYNPEFYQVAV